MPLLEELTSQDTPFTGAPLKSDSEEAAIRAWALRGGTPSRQLVVVVRTQQRAEALIRALERQAEWGDKSFRTDAMFSFLHGATIRVFVVGSEEDACRAAGLYFGGVYWADPPVSNEVASLIYRRIDRAFNELWSPQPRKAVEGDIYPFQAWGYWFGKQLAEVTIRNFLWDSNPFYRHLVQRSRDELTGTG